MCNEFLIEYRFNSQITASFSWCIKSDILSLVLESLTANNSNISLLFPHEKIGERTPFFGDFGENGNFHTPNEELWEKCPFP